MWADASVFKPTTRLCTKGGLVETLRREVLRRSTMFIALTFKSPVPQRSAMFGMCSYIPLLTERMNFENWSYKHTAPPEQKPRLQR